MKRIVLAVLLLTGCVATPVRDTKVNELERESQEIAARARQCEVAAIKHSIDAKEPAEGSRSPDGYQPRIDKDERDREISKCKAGRRARTKSYFRGNERNTYVKPSRSAIAERS